eukprot:PLAT3349.13.p1 GENE.PLAT3349.13~~PLAT3349.13.p1  ORF type:complete len:511 (+),score=121.15 PLAT3349.13:225-1757(+)
MSTRRVSTLQGLYAPYSKELTAEMAKVNVSKPGALLVLSSGPMLATLLGFAPYFLPWRKGDGMTAALTVGYGVAMVYPGWVIAASISTFLKIKPYTPLQLVAVIVPGVILLPLLHNVSNAFGWFPFPFAPVAFGFPAVYGQLAMALYLLGADVRRSHWTELKSVMMMLLFLFSATSGWMLYRLLFEALSGVAQALSILCLPLLRLGSLYTLDHIVHGKVDTSGSMIVPVSFGIEMYNALFNASLFTSVATPFNAALIIVTDMAGTLFYFGIMLDVWKRLYDCCSSSSKRSSKVLPETAAAAERTDEKSVEASLAVICIEDDADADEEPDDGSASAATPDHNDHTARDSVASLGQTYRGWRVMARFGTTEMLATDEARRFRWKLRISGFLLVEEFVELQVPVLMMVLTTFMRSGWQSGAFPTMEGMSDERYVLSLQYLGISLLSEAVLFTTTSIILWRRFHIDVIQHLYFLASKYWQLFFSLMCLITLFTVSLLTSYSGVDFTFTFAWLPK